MSETHTTRQVICCVGEVLWDALPEGLFLGGAPLNVSCNLSALGVEANMVSRVGRDRLGKEALRNLQGRGMSIDYIQLDDEHETGFVEVNLEQKEGPGYEILEPVAWDYIEYTEQIEALADAADIVVFGTLAQRNAVSLQTIQQLIRRGTLSIYDINLRPPYDNTAIVEQALHEADIVKMNSDELMVLADWFGYPRELRKAAERLALTFDCQQVCITSGRDGAVLLSKGLWTQQEGLDVEVVDTVGSGDAFLAAFIFGLTRFETDLERLQFANLLGAFVATKPGANPSYTLSDVRSFARAREVQIDFTRILTPGAAGK